MVHRILTYIFAMCEFSAYGVMYFYIIFVLCLCDCDALNFHFPSIWTKHLYLYSIPWADKNLSRGIKCLYMLSIPWDRFFVPWDRIFVPWDRIFVPWDRMLSRGIEFCPVGSRCVPCMDLVVHVITSKHTLFWNSGISLIDEH